VYSILKTDIEVLCRKHHCIETLFRKLFSFASIGMMKRISEMLEDNATERYGIFLSENGGLLQRISLGDLSSYLGITQVSLSRIRSGK
jgi:CRP-like cAMP-binding protein